MRFSHTADIHVIKNEIEPLKSLEFIIEESIRKNSEYLMISGDLFDEPIDNDSDSTIHELIRILQEGSQRIPISIIRGNHDPLGSLEIFNRLETNNRLYATEKNEIIQLSTEGKLIPFSTKILDRKDIKAYILTICYPEKSLLLIREEVKYEETNRLVEEKIEQILKDMDALIPYQDVLKLESVHLSIRGYSTANQRSFKGDNYVISAATLNCINPDYVGAGHIHKYQSFYPNFPRTVYSSSAWRVNFGEPDEKFFCLVDIDKDKKYYNLNKVEIPTKKRIIESIEVFNKADITTLETLYEKHLTNTKDFIQIRIMCSDNLYDKISHIVKTENVNITKSTFANKKSVDPISKKLNKSKSLNDDMNIYCKYREAIYTPELKKLVSEIEDEYKTGIGNAA